MAEALICDQCKKVSDRKIPMTSFYVVSHIKSQIALGSGGQKHLCTPACLLEYAQSLLPEETGDGE